METYSPPLRFPHKARLVANGHSQQIGVDCDKTFSPVVKPATIRVVLSLAASRHWLVYHLDVKNAFLYGHLSETIYMHHPPGVSVSRDDTGMFLHQRQYALEVLERAGMLNCHPCHTPVDIKRELGVDGPHLAALKWILRYVRGTLDYGLQMYSSLSGSLIGYTDVDWAVNLSRLRAKDEYRGVANVVTKTAWLRNLLRELHSPLQSATLVYCDNFSVVYLSSNPVQHQRTKHIEIDIYFVRDQVAADHVRVFRGGNF
ncbi:ribonuclease H-like domain-containing protein [Tanacetum coccineum]